MLKELQLPKVWFVSRVYEVNQVWESVFLKNFQIREFENCESEFYIYI